MARSPYLHLYLVDSSVAILCLDIHHRQFLGTEIALVIGIFERDLLDRVTVGLQDTLQKMKQQIKVTFRGQDLFKNHIHRGTYIVNQRKTSVPVWDGDKI